MVKFTAKFAVDDRKGEVAYDAFIKDLRRRLAVGDTIEGIPTLTPQVAPGGDLEFFDVDLSYSTKRVYLRFRIDNLSLVGYRPHNSTIWYELGQKDQSSPLINEPGTTTEMLGFGSSYDDLNAAGYTGYKGLQVVEPGASSIGDAINELTLNRDAQYRARGIIKLTFVISEATRFRDVSSLVCKSWSGGFNSVNLDTALVARVYSWARLSSAVQRAQHEGLQFEFDAQKTDLWTYEEAIPVLGIMHFTNTARSTRSKRYSTDIASTIPYAQGQPLLEIFHVRVNYYGDKNTREQLYGNITVTDSVGSADIWALDRNRYVTMEVGDIVLGGPSRPLSAADEFTIEMDIRNYTSGRDKSGEAKFKFNPLDCHTNSKYDVPTTRRISLYWGSVNLSYMAMSDGLYAKISVILIRGDKEAKANVYGDINASNGFGQTLLFRKPYDYYVVLKRQSPIPLSKAFVAVPTDKTLRVNADLYDNSDDRVQIAWGSVEFQPLYMRSESKRIVGASGVVEVRVTWM
ncbi:hypothetical protein D9757_006832 [Collybiopsis confluens]|uniref:rRNA N-glycosylase n=1 Tax=Collybiopsis confluens TaxID=2823264 RepID=A0A8H5HPJ8_9AGAR|nr:hypothetical protein D9757_006832 [Collybiopsis confluens]